MAVHGQLKVVKAVLQDQAGTPYQLKGASSYWLNWESTKYAESKSALQYMRDNWKLSAFRAAMGTDASSGYLTSSANATALQARIDTIVQNALALGVYVLVDWHTEKAATQQAQSIAFFTGLAQKYGACPNLIYEDYNEPTGVTWAQIKPYHQAVVSAVRAIDPDNLIVLGTPNWSQDVDLAAADPVSGSNLLYTLHWYACSHKASLRAKGTTAISRGAALFVTESAATSANGGVAPNNTVCEAEANSWYSWMSDNHVSGIAWKLASGTDSSNIFASGSKPPVDGPFPDSVLSQTNGTSPGHGLFAVNWMRQ
ncbi:MAG: glycoside hydrolase family 5 protein [Myxococcales bacterium]